MTAHLTAIAFLNSPFDLIAIYAAVVATLSLGWNIYTWARRERTRIDVTGSAGAIDQGSFDRKPAFAFHCTNRSAHAVEIRRVWSEGRGTSKETVQVEPNEGPGVSIDPRSAFDWFARYEELAQEGIDLRKGVTGHVVLVTGESDQSQALYAPERAVSASQASGDSGAT